MNYLLRNSVLLLVMMGFAACSSLFPKDNTPKPVDVPTFKASVELQSVDTFSVDEAGKARVFEPLWLQGAAWAVGVDGKVKTKTPGKDALRELDFKSKLGSALDGNEKMLVAASPEGRVLALAVDGRLLWQRDIKAEVLARPRVAGENVFVRTQDGRLLALNAVDGEIRWQTELKNPALILHVPIGMAISDGTVFVAWPGGRVRAYDSAEGKMLWESWVAQPKGASELERMTDVVGDPWLDDSQVCAVSYQGKIACFDKAKGNVQWSRDFSSVTGLTGDHRQVYATDDMGRVVAFDKTTGRQIWKQDKLFARKVTRPTVYGKYVAVADYEGKVYLLDGETGEFAGMGDVDDAVRAPLVVADESLLVQDEDGDVTVLRLR